MATARSKRLGTELPLALARDVGRLVAEASFLERTLSFLVGAIRGAGRAAVDLQEHQPMARALQTQIIEAAKGAGLDKEDLRILELCLNQAQDLFVLRNEIVHSHWLRYHHGVLVIEKLPPRPGQPVYRREWTLKLIRAVTHEMALRQQELEKLHTHLAKKNKAARFQIGLDKTKIEPRWKPPAYR